MVTRLTLAPRPKPTSKASTTPTANTSFENRAVKKWAMEGMAWVAGRVGALWLGAMDKETQHGGQAGGWAAAWRLLDGLAGWACGSTWIKFPLTPSHRVVHPERGRDILLQKERVWQRWPQEGRQACGRCRATLCMCGG